MKSKLISALLLTLGFFLPGSAFGQTAPTPPVQHFVMSGSAAGQPASIATAGVQLTSSVSVVYEYIVNPNDSSKPRYGSGLANYTFGVDKLVPKALKSKLLIDPSNYLLTLQAGAGKESLANPAGGARISHIIGNFGVYGGYPLPGGHSQIGLGYKWIVGPGTNVVVKVPVGSLTFTF